MKGGIAAAISLVGLIQCGGAMADGNDLLADCSEAIRFQETRVSDPSASSYCNGEVSGVMNTMYLLNEFLPKDMKTCFPPEIKTKQAVRIVVKHLQDNPTILHLPASHLILGALHGAYACK